MWLATESDVSSINPENCVRMLRVKKKKDNLPGVISPVIFR